MNIVERWSETESEGEKAIVGGKHWGWKEGGTTTTIDRARKLAPGGGWYARDKEE